MIVLAQRRWLLWALGCRITRPAIDPKSQHQVHRETCFMNQDRPWSAQVNANWCVVSQMIRALALAKLSGTNTLSQHFTTQNRHL
jgi:hypothetical protein